MLFRPAPAARLPDIHGRLPALDAVRGLAILLVTLFRFRDGPQEDRLSRVATEVLNQGHFGVDLFFVLSGFLITGVLFDAKSQVGYFRNFYIRRTLRIFPLYYAVLLLTLVVLPAILPSGSSVFAERSPYGPWLWLYAANFAQCWQMDWALGPFNHFWSLAIEEHFYLVWPLLIWALSRRQAMYASLACVAIGLFGKLTALTIWPHTVVPAEVFTLCRVDALGMGAFLALAARGPGGLEKVLTWRFAIAVVAAGLTIGALVGKQVLQGSAPHAAQLIYWSGFTPVAGLFGALLLGALAAPPGTLAASFWNHRWLQLAGKYSYGWYVFQGLMVMDFNRYLPNELWLSWAGGVSWLACLLKILVGSGLSLGLAVLSWHLFEKQCLAWKERLTVRA